MSTTAISTRERSLRGLLAVLLGVVVWRLGFSSSTSLVPVEATGAAVIGLAALSCAVTGKSPRLGGLTSDFSLAFLAARLFVGWEFFYAGWEKLITEPGWVGSGAGTSITGFLGNAVSPASTSGAHAAVPQWFASLTSNTFLNHTELMSYLVVFGELAVGLGLIFGICTRSAAAFGAIMNLVYLLAGSTGGGINPVMLVIEPMIVASSMVGVYALSIDRTGRIADAAHRLIHAGRTDSPERAHA